MRKFLVDYDSEWTLDELREFFEKESDDRAYFDSFEEWLDRVLRDKNGSLTEILTEDTPREQAAYAVARFVVTDAETGDTYEKWLPAELVAPELFA